MPKMSDSRIRPTPNWFEAKGLHQNYQTEGLGAANPVAPNANDDGSDNPEGRAKNRRVASCSLYLHLPRAWQHLPTYGRHKL